MKDILLLKVGHRIGITGSSVIENGNIVNINYISSLNFRVAKEIIGCSKYMINKIINNENECIYNTLIISLPGAGKTTLVRDIVRNLSNGTEKLHGQTIGLIDERGEIAASYKGVPQNNIGLRTDVFSNTPKSIGMKMLIRSMSPQIIVADEIGNKDDVDAIQDAIYSRNKRNIYSTWSKLRRNLFK